MNGHGTLFHHVVLIVEGNPALFIIELHLRLLIDHLHLNLMHAHLPESSSLVLSRKLDHEVSSAAC